MNTIKEYQIRLDNFKRPVMVVKHEHSIPKVHDISGTYDCPEKAADIINTLFDVSTLAEEYVWMLTLSTNCKITGIFEISHGSIDRSLVPSREIIQKALLSGAVGIILVHCHPSGSPEPSDIDLLITKRLKDACDLVGIALHDHVIIGCDASLPTYSFLENSKVLGGTQ